ncbi:MAG: GDYXXLXY domain-containing protein [Burkholderiales bacterium]
MRKALAVLAGLAIVAAANWTIASREKQLAEGAVVLLELAPVDPRSLMQGDYMALRFEVENDAFGRARREELADGRLVVRLDDRGVATFVRRDGGEPLGAGEIRLRYRVRDGRVKFATNAYFFQEGTAKVYERARYGEFRASPSGELLLTHLRGESLERLGPR